MPVTYPLSLPSAFKSSKITIAAENLVGVFTGQYDLSEQVYEFPGKRWHLTIECPAMSPQNAEQIVGWLLALNGRAGTFYCNDTSHRAPYGVATGTPTVNGTQTAASQDLLTTGWTASVTGILKAGDWVQVGTGSTMRLHKVCFDANSDASGNADLIVWPRLRGAYAGGTSIVTTNASGIFMLKADPSWDIDVQRVYGLKLTGVEALTLD